MSDHEETSSDMGYVTPVPELDDHRHQSSSIQRADRPRRGTFDSLYGTRQQAEDGAADKLLAPSVKVRDFEEAIVDDEAEVVPPTRRSRRPTLEAAGDPRAASPPNSVKAFAEARRREREMSFSESKGDRKGDDDDLHRAVSVASRRSYRSKPHTVDNDAASLATNKSATDDVCFPLQDEHRKDQLYIDFGYLETLIADEERLGRAESRRDSAVRVFYDVRPKSSVGGEGSVQMATVDGDILEMPSDMSSSHEKQQTEDSTESPKAQVTQSDPNRFSFFSSAWESTIHAAELGDLVLPGEDLRGLFALPRDESDGVWWLNMNNLTVEEVQGICRAFGIHPLTVEDITTQETREKIELFPSYYFACFRSFATVDDGDGQEYEPFYVYVVVFREGTLSFSFTPNAHASHVRKRIAVLKDYVALSSDWICYALM
jgi:magnesium transporter